MLRNRVLYPCSYHLYDHSYIFHLQFNLMNKNNIQLNKQFVLKGRSTFLEKFTIYGFFESFYDRNDVLLSPFCFICTVTSCFANEAIEILKISKLKNFIFKENTWYSYNIGLFNIDEFLILPSRKEIQSKVIQDSNLSQNIIHKIIQVYL